MLAASPEAAEQMLHAAGWRTLDERTSYCPRCSSVSAGDYARRPRRANPSSILGR
jgi:hypothetical protein